MNGDSYGDEFLKDFAHLSTIGATRRGGVDREAATLPDAMQRAWLGGWLASRGFRVMYDAIGNQFGLLELAPGAPYVLTGSHLDSQPTAGRFDGAYGVAVSASAAREVADAAELGDLTPRCNIAVVNWFNEEGSRFAPSMMGSSVFTGKMSLADAYATTDRAGISVEGALSGLGMIGEMVDLDVASYAEIHIEQGRELERSGAQIGVVTGTWGARKFRVRIAGEQSHTGSTLMADRKDALLGAAELIVFARQLADRFPTPPLHTAVSTMDVYPNSPVVVVSSAELNLDLRCSDPQTLTEAEALVRSEAERIATSHGLTIEIERTHAWESNDYTEALFALSESVSENLGLSHQRILTVAGHDSTNMKDVAPTVMLFVPSREGISHNELEETSEPDMLAGRAVVVAVLRELVTAGLA